MPILTTPQGKVLELLILNKPDMYTNLVGIIIAVGKVNTKFITGQEAIKPESGIMTRKTR